MRALVLVPTSRERDVVLASAPESRDLAMLLGFGPVAAAARAAALIAQHRPERVLLVGIAGTYDEVALPVGAAARLAACAVDGIGAGSAQFIDRMIAPIDANRPSSCCLAHVDIVNSITNDHRILCFRSRVRQSLINHCGMRF